MTTADKTTTETTPVATVATPTAATTVVTPTPTPVVDKTVTPAVPVVAAVVAQASGAVVSTASDKVGAVVPKEVVAAVKAQKEEVANPGLFSNETQSLVDQIVATKNGAAINVIEGIKAYMASMVPGKIMTSVDGARNQALLFRTLQSAINGVQDDFQLLFATILKIMDENSNGIFGGRYIFRFTENLALNADDRQGFLRILNLMMTGAAVKGRAEAMKQVDFHRSLQYSLTDEGKQRILAFFNK